MLFMALASVAHLHLWPPVLNKLSLSLDTLLSEHIAAGHQFESSACKDNPSSPLCLFFPSYRDEAMRRIFGSMRGDNHSEMVPDSVCLVAEVELGAATYAMVITRNYIRVVNVDGTRTMSDYNNEPDRFSIPIRAPFRLWREGSNSIFLKTILGGEFVFFLPVDGINALNNVTADTVISEIQARRDLRRGVTTYDPMPDNIMEKVVAADPSTSQVWLNHGFMSKTYQERDWIPGGVEIDRYNELSKSRTSRRSLLFVFQVPSGSVVLRASQPTTESRCIGDREIAMAARRDNRIVVVDLRGWFAIIDNWMHGGGTEQIDSYSGHNKKSKHYTSGIGNVRVVLQAWKDANSDSLALLMKGRKWVKQLRTIVKALKSCVENLESSPTTMVIHCTDGWDRTPEMCALIQIAMCANYRTVKGFTEVLIREFSKRGHKFGKHYSDPGLDERSPAPILPQFFEIVHILIQSNPDEFEFGDDYLLWLAWNVYSHRFIEFVTNAAQFRKSEAQCHVYDSVTQFYEEFKRKDTTELDDGPLVYRTLQNLEVGDAYEPWSKLIGNKIPFPGARERDL